MNNTNEFIEALLQNDNKYNDQIQYKVIGDSNQSLQILLPPNIQCYTKPKFITYFNKIKQNGNKKLQYEDCFIQYINEQQQALSYIGLQGNQGKILTLRIEINPEIFIQDQYILAFTEYEKCQEMKQRLIHNTKHYQNNPNIKKGNFLDNIVFVQSKNLIIEKQLGIDERFFVKEDNILAFSDTCSLTKVKSQQGIQNLIRIKGPGKVYVVMGSEQKSQIMQYKNISKFCILFLIIIALVLLDFLVFPPLFQIEENK